VTPAEFAGEHHEISGTARKLHEELLRCGHFIVATNGPDCVGTTWDAITTVSGQNIPGPMILKAQSTLSAYKEQSKRLGLTGKLPPGYVYFYEVAAE
jgi:hypothetical protein